MTAEKDVSLGEFLRHERESRGITIEQVASATKIGVRTLHALEADQFAELPAKPFIRGFVNSYCRFIGLDPKEILTRFEDFIDQKTTERPNREKGHSGYAFEKRDSEQQSRTILLIAIVSFIVLGGVFMIFLKPSLRHHSSSQIDKLRAVHNNASKDSLAEFLSTPGATPSAIAFGIPSGIPPSLLSPTPSALESPVSHDASSSPVDNSVTPKASTSSGSAEISSPTPKPTPSLGTNSADPLDSGLELKSHEVIHKIIVKVLADIWVRYQVDQRPVRKFIIRKGRVLILRAKDTIRLQVSNPNSVVFNYNSQGLHPMNQSHQTVLKQGIATLFFPPEIGEKIDNPFEDSRPFPKTPDPTPDSNDPDTQPES